MRAITIVVPWVLCFTTLPVFVLSDDLPRVSFTDNTHRLDYLDFVDDRFVAVTGNGRVSFSNDAETWEAHGFIGLTVTQMIKHHNRLIAVGHLGNPFQGALALSDDDGRHWETIQFTETNLLTSVAVHDNRLVASADGGLLLSIDGGNHWSFQPFDGSWTGIIYARGSFVALSPESGLLRSNDGLTWTQDERTFPFDAKIEGNDDLMVIVADTFLVSMDGKTWRSEGSTAGMASRRALRKVGERGFVVLGTGRYYLSVNGIDWSGYKLQEGVYPQLLAVGNGTLLYELGTNLGVVNHPTLSGGRLMTHVTRSDGTFDTRLQLRNAHPVEAASYELIAYNEDGTELARRNGILNPGLTLRTDPGQLFGSDAVSHLRVHPLSTLHLQATYVRKDDTGSRAQVAAGDSVARQWMVVPAGTPGYWDGLAVINRGDGPTDLHATLQDAEGKVLTERTLISQLAPNAKALLNLQVLMPTADGRVQLDASEPLAVLALRGDSDATQLVPGSAQATPAARTTVPAHNPAMMTFTHRDETDGGGCSDITPRRLYHLYTAMLQNDHRLVAVPNCQASCAVPHFHCDYVRTSEDGVNWVETPVGNTAPLQGGVWGEDRFVLVGDMGQIYVSLDGITWETHTLPVAQRLEGVAYNGSAFLAYSATATPWTSANGVDWIEAGAQPLTHVVGADNLFVGYHEGQLLRSETGIDWAVADSPGQVVEMVVSQGVFFACQPSGSLRTSVDGLTWRTHTLDTGSDLIGATILNGNTFVTDANGNLFTSYDLKHWQRFQTNYLPGVGNLTVFDGALIGSNTNVLLRNTRLPTTTGAPLIAHVTRADGEFTTGTVISNPTNAPQTYSMTAFGEDGAKLGVIEGILAPEETMERTVADSFPGLPVTHCRFEGAAVNAWVVYQTVSASEAPVHMEPIATGSKTWWLHPDTRPGYWEGLAVVNTGSAPATVTVRQVGATGIILDERIMATELAPLGKALHVLDFEPLAWAQIVIIADQPVAAIALRGQGEQFWQTALVAEE